MFEENFQSILNETGETISATEKNVKIYVDNKEVAEFDLV
jgi:predicted RecB family endonuclease